MIKLVVTDLDGTFLDHEKKISHKNANAVKKLRKEGITLCICTGRIYASAYLIAQELKLNSPIISCNGAFIKDPLQNLILYNNKMNNSILAEILDIMNDFDTVYHFYSEDTIFSNKLERNAKVTFDCFKDVFDPPIKVIVSNDLKFNLKNITGVNKFIIFEENAFIRQEMIDRLSQLRDIDITQSGEDNIEIMSKGTSKGFGVRFLKERFGLSKDEVMVLGDHYNDLSMFDEATYSVSMGNGIEEIKKLSYYTTKPNSESGFTHAVEKLIFGKEDKSVYR